MKPVIPQSDILPCSYLDEVRAYATSGFTPEHIASIMDLNPVARALFLERVNTPSDEFYRAYQNGFNVGRHTVRNALKNKADKGEPEAVKLFMQSVNDEQTLELRRELFGV